LDIRDKISKGVSILLDGGIVAFPTDTVYGLGACFDNVAAVRKIYHLKQRPRNVGLPLLMANTAQMKKMARDISPVAWRLAETFWPGALTLILFRSGSVPVIVTGGGETVALRVPNHPVTIALIRDTGKPIIGTSANLTGQPSALRAADVFCQLGDSIDLIVDGGMCPGGIESTIVDVTGKMPRLLRQGALSRTEIECVCHLA
jgi:L-threonylcarbamoyladenylate synthase